jgi:hypothetical protein
MRAGRRPRTRIADPLALTILTCALGVVRTLAQAPADSPAGPPPAATHPIIASIHIEREDVFDLSREEDRHFPYTLANRLHIVTREDVIRRELLFREGDPADPDVLYETERNLRRLTFLHPNTRIEVRPRDDGRVDVVVHTRDTWTTRPELSFKREANETTAHFALLEGNLLGRGKTASVSYKKELDRDSGGILYSDPRLGGTWWTLDGSYFDRSDGLLWSIGAERPFYSLLTPRGGGGFASHFSQVTNLRLDGDEAPGFRHRRTDVRIGYALALRASYREVRRIHFGFGLNDSRFSLEPGEPPLDVRPPLGGADYVALPEDRHFRVLEMEYRASNVDFIKVNYLDKFDRTQDINLGRDWSAALGISPAALGDDHTHLFVRGEYARWFQPSLFNYVRARALARGRLKSWIGEDVIGEIDLTHYYLGLPRQTLVAHLGQAWGHNLDGDHQFLLGADTGLRGYDSRRFDGNKRLLMNFEDRVYLTFDWLHLLSVGFATFADAGYVWRAGGGQDLGDLVADVGVGLRFDVTRNGSGSTFRIDWAYPLNRVGQEENSRGVLSVASGLAW